MIGASMDFQKYHRALAQVDGPKAYGKVVGVVGLVLEASMPQASIGDLCKIYTGSGEAAVSCSISGRLLSTWARAC